MVVLDSSIIIDALRLKNAALDLIDSYSGKETVAITIISKYEVLRGATGKDLDIALSLFRRFRILDFDDLAVDEVVKAYKRLVDKGKMVNELDLLIAGIAAANNETLLTRDRDFLKFESPKIIVLQ